MDEFLKKNPRQLARILNGIVDNNAIDAIETALKVEVALIYNLGIIHYRFALSLSNHNWRQKVSRSYYAAYNCSKAARCIENGNFSKDASDHQKLNKLPNDFPNNNNHINFLDAFRKDRNYCDYDHNAKVKNLIHTQSEYLRLTRDFLTDGKVYLNMMGVNIIGRI